MAEVFPPPCPANPRCRRSVGADHRRFDLSEPAE
jgi:hypothetical protein